VIKRSLAGGPLSRAELRERIAAAGVRIQGQALIHLLALAYLRGVAVRGPVRGREQAYVLAVDWLGPPPPVDRDRALAELARRYLAGHGPASDYDLAQWAGLPVGDARRGLRAIAGELAGRPDGLAALAGSAADGTRRRLPPPRLLGAFEPLLLGWSSREPVLGGYGPRIVAGGMFRPFLLAAGRAAGTWAVTAGKVSVSPFAPLSAPAERALAAEAADVERFLTGTARHGRSG
jgi:hypothetical protein